MPVSDNDRTKHHDASTNTTAQNESRNNPRNGSPASKSTIINLLPLNAVKKLAKAYRTEISAGSSSVLATVSAFPLDFTKSRMQSYGTSLGETVKDVYKAEGAMAFWRGVGPPILSIMVVRTISFSLYQKTKYALDRSFSSMGFGSPLGIANAPGTYPSLSTMACFGLAGAASGAAITFISCPFELTKLSEQLAGKEAREAAMKKPSAGSGGTRPVIDLKGEGAWKTARRLIRDRGFQGLYIGYRLHLLRDTIGTTMYFMIYESAKQLLGNARGKSATSPYAVLVAGGLCGIVSWTSVYPIDNTKTLYQKALLSAGSEKRKRPPIKYFDRSSYRGLGVSVVRSSIMNMIFFSNFEFVKKKINALEVDED